MKLFSFRNCYCGTANSSPPPPVSTPLPDDGPRRRHLTRSNTSDPSVWRPNLSTAAPSPLPDDANDGPCRRYLTRSKTSGPSAWRPKLSAILEDRVVSPPPVANEKSVEREEGGSRKQRRRRRPSELKKSETFNYGDEQFVSRRKNSFSMAMGTFSASPFMI